MSELNTYNFLKKEYILRSRLATLLLLVGAAMLPIASYLLFYPHLSYISTAFFVLATFLLLCSISLSIMRLYKETKLNQRYLILWAIISLFFLADLLFFIGTIFLWPDLKANSLAIFFITLGGFAYTIGASLSFIVFVRVQTLLRSTSKLGFLIGSVLYVYGGVLFGGSMFFDAIVIYNIASSLFFIGAVMAVLNEMIYPSK